MPVDLQTNLLGAVIRNQFSIWNSFITLYWRGLDLYDMKFIVLKTVTYI